MNRYTTKHFWRMKESEQGEWIRYEEHEKTIKQLMTRYREMNEYMYLKYEKEYRLSNHLFNRMLILYYVLMATYGVIVAKLIAWSLGL